MGSSPSECDSLEDCSAHVSVEDNMELFDGFFGKSSNLGLDSVDCIHSVSQAFINNKGLPTADRSFRNPPPP
jgi:hypothetical protein